MLVRRDRPMSEQKNGFVQSDGMFLLRWAAGLVSCGQVWRQYQGLRRKSGLWVNRRITLSQSFMIGGYVLCRLGVDAIVIKFDREKQLRYAAWVRVGFVPPTRRRCLRGSNRCIDLRYFLW
jgi:hypothetical protein